MITEEVIQNMSNHDILIRYNAMINFKSDDYIDGIPCWVIDKWLQKEVDKCDLNIAWPSQEYIPT